MLLVFIVCLCGVLCYWLCFSLMINFWFWCFDISVVFLFLSVVLVICFSFVFFFHLIYTTNNQLKDKEQRTNTNQWTPKHTKKGHGTNNKNKGHCQSQRKTQFHETRKPTRTIINNTCNVVGVRYVRVCLMFLGIDCVLFSFIRVDWVCCNCCCVCMCWFRPCSLWLVRVLCLSFDWLKPKNISN